MKLSSHGVYFCASQESSRTAVLEQQEVSLRYLRQVLKEQAQYYQQMMEDQVQLSPL